MTEQNNCGERKCPFKFENFNFQTLMLIILTLKTIWGSLNQQTPEIDIEELIFNRFQQPGMPFLNSNFNSVPTPNRVCNTDFSISRMIFLGFFIYLIFIIRDLFSFSEENEDNNQPKCPFRFC